MPYKDRELYHVMRSMGRLKRALAAGRTYHPRDAASRELRQRSKLYWRLWFALKARDNLIYCLRTHLIRVNKWTRSLIEKTARSTIPELRG